MKTAKTYIGCVLFVPTILLGQSSKNQEPAISLGAAFKEGYSFASPVKDSAGPVNPDAFHLNAKNEGCTQTAVMHAGQYAFKSSNESESAFPKGSLGIGLGIGLGNVYWGAGYGMGLPVSPTLTVDYAITNKIGIGNIAVGLTGSYSSSKYSGLYDDYNYSGILIGLRGSYHFIMPGSVAKKLDPYAGVLLAYIITKDPVDTDLDYGLPGKASAFQPGVFAGAHYFFAGHIGAYAELGYNGFSIFSLGITFKF